MPGRHQSDLDGAPRDALAIGGRLGGLREILAIACRYDRQGLRRRQNRAMAAAGMVGMAMSDDRPGHGAHGIDVKIPRWAIKPFRCVAQEVTKPSHEEGNVPVPGWFGQLAVR